jgi:hypothetical protein
MVLAASGASSSTSKTLQAAPSTLHMGLDGYVWWIGVVENRKDPLKLGRAQVRIHAWHTADKAAMPTETLPWAQAVQPINATHGNVVPPKEGTTVVGFFMDGKEGQIPVMTGILNGIPSEKVPSSKGFSDPGTDLESRPKLPGQQQASTYPVKINEPMTINLARNEMLEGANSYIDIRDVTRIKTVVTATSLIPDISSLVKAITLPIPGLSSFIGALGGIVSGLTSGLVGSISGTIGNITSGITSGLSGITGSISGSVTGAIGSATSGISGAVGGTLNNAVTNISGAATGAINNVTGQITGSIENAVGGAVGGVTQSIDSTISGASESLQQAVNGFNIPQNLSSDLKNIVNDLKLPSLVNFSSSSTSTWEEPKSPYNAQYPYNVVTQTESGHITEYDDTPGAERIHIRHRTGTYDEMQPDGSKVTHVFGNNYHIVAKDENILISGVCNITVNGDANFLIRKNMRHVVEGDAVYEFKKGLRITVGENLIVENGGDFIHGTVGTQTWASNIYTFK